MSVTIVVVGAAILPALVFMSNKNFLRIIKFESGWESLSWTWRLATSKFTFPQKLEQWQHPREGASEERMISVMHAWEFLFPFFASRGYTMFSMTLASFGTLIPPAFPPVASDTKYPYARQDPTRSPARIGWGTPSMWCARDALGRDVVIKAISEVGNPSQELKVMQRLNSERLRSDPYNHTIFALEFLTFDNFIFVVMPRWDSAIAPEFESVSQLMFFALIWFQTFAFLHHNRIVHGDFLTQNIGMNAVMDPSERTRRVGMRNPKEVRYALFDFGASTAYPEDVVIEDILSTDFLSLDSHSLPEDSVQGPYNPFKADIAFLGSCLQIEVRHLENIIPELGPFFERLVDMTDPKQFTAAQALARFSEIYDGISSEVAQQPFNTWRWRDGRITHKRGDVLIL